MKSPLFHLIGWGIPAALTISSLVLHQVFIHLFIYSYYIFISSTSGIHSFIHLFITSFIHLFLLFLHYFYIRYSFIYSSFHLFIYSFIYLSYFFFISFTLGIHPFIHLFTLSSFHSFFYLCFLTISS